MKVLYIGYFKENSDWGQFAVNNILALEKAGCDVVCRAIEFGNHETPKKIKHLENKNLEGVDYCIQHVFPEHMVGTEKFKKNVGYFCNEAVKIDHSTWTERLSVMDEIWTPYENKNFDYKVVPHALDTDKFKNNYSGLSIPSVDHTFKFYNIVNTLTLPSVIKAFHSEFDVSEPVHLLLQMDLLQASEQKTQELNNFIGSLKEKMGLHKSIHSYKKDFISSHWETEISKLQFHDYGDCFISNNVTTANLQDLEAAAFGSGPIVAEKSPSAILIDEATKINGTFVSKEKAESSMFPTMNNAKDFTISVCEIGLRRAMREKYEEWSADPMSKIENRKRGMIDMDRYSLEKSGQRMKEALSV